MLWSDKLEHKGGNIKSFLLTGQLIFLVGCKFNSVLGARLKREVAY